MNSKPEQLLVAPKKIVILGMPRSGSTLARQVLIESGKVAMPHCCPGTFFGELAQSYNNAHTWSVDMREALGEWSGESTYHEDIRHVNPVSGNRYNVGPCPRMTILKRSYQQIIDHMMNPTNLSSHDFVGIKNVDDFKCFALVWRMMASIYGGDECKIIITLRHPFSQIRSMCNTPWSCNKIQTNEEAVSAFWIRLEWWKEFASTVFYEQKQVVNPAFVLFYEDIPNAHEQMCQWAGLNVSHNMRSVLSGPKLNPSNIRFPLNEDCFQAAHEAYMNCDFIRCGHGPVCLDKIEELVR